MLKYEHLFSDLSVPNVLEKFMAFSKKQSGLTLVEMMITVGIVSVLAAISWNFYNEQSRTGRRSDLIVGTASIAQVLEQFRSDSGRYDTIAAVNFNNYKPNVTTTNPQECNARGFQGTIAPFVSCNNHYNFTIAFPTATSYVISATVASADLVSNEAECITMTINELGVKGVTSGTGTVQRCWGSN